MIVRGTAAVITAILLASCAAGVPPNPASVAPLQRDVVASACSWRLMSPPKVPGFAFLDSVSAASPTFAVAVGYIYPPGSPKSDRIRPLVIFGQGRGAATKWKIVPLRVRNVSLSSVSALSSSDVWVAGSQIVSARTQVPFLARWNGSSWVKTPLPPSIGHGVLTTISAHSSTDVLAGGYSGSPSDEHALILHWDGTAWAVQSVPASSDSVVTGVIDASPAYATVEATPASPSVASLFRGESGSWSQVAQRSGGTYFNGIASAAGGAFVSGFILTADPHVTLPLIEFWNGTTLVEQNVQGGASNGVYTGVAYDVRGPLAVGFAGMSITSPIASVQRGGLWRTAGPKFGSPHAAFHKVAAIPYVPQYWAVGLGPSSVLIALATCK